MHRMTRQCLLATHSSTILRGWCLTSVTKKWWLYHCARVAIFTIDLLQIINKPNSIHQTRETLFIMECKVSQTDSPTFLLSKSLLISKSCEKTLERSKKDNLAFRHSFCKIICMTCRVPSIFADDNGVFWLRECYFLFKTSMRIISPPPAKVFRISCWPYIP